MGTRIRRNKQTKKYELRSEYLKTSFEGSLEGICQYAMDKGLVKKDDLSIALQEMLEKSHSEMLFGMTGGFLYSDD